MKTEVCYKYLHNFFTNSSTTNNYDNDGGLFLLRTYPSRHDVTGAPYEVISVIAGGQNEGFGISDADLHPHLLKQKMQLPHSGLYQIMLKLVLNRHERF